MRYEVDVLLRYLSLMPIIYFFLSPLFLVPITAMFYFISYHFLNLITHVQFIGGELLVENEFRFLIIDACISPSAYMFISFIFLMLPIKFSKNIILLFKALLMFTFVNLIRILLLMWVHVKFGVETFETFHFIFYEGISGILTAAIIIYFLRGEHKKKTYPLFSDIIKLVKCIKK